jgi:hypothetical protein
LGSVYTAPFLFVSIYLWMFCNLLSANSKPAWANEAMRIQLQAPLRMSLEPAIDYVGPDELVEASMWTSMSIRAFAKVDYRYLLGCCHVTR